VRKSKVAGTNRCCTIVRSLCYNRPTDGLYSMLPAMLDRALAVAAELTKTMTRRRRRPNSIGRDAPRLRCTVLQATDTFHPSPATPPFVLSSTPAAVWGSTTFWSAVRQIVHRQARWRLSRSPTGATVMANFLKSLSPSLFTCSYCPYISRNVCAWNIACLKRLLTGLQINSRMKESNDQKLDIYVSEF